MRRFAAGAVVALAITVPVAIATAHGTSAPVTNPMAVPLDAGGQDITNAHSITGATPGQGLYLYSAPFDPNALIQADTGPAPTYHSGAAVEVEAGTASSAGRVVLQGEGILISQGNENRMILAGSLKPSASPGFAAQVGSLYSRDDGSGHGQLWFKTGTDPRDWIKVAP